MYLHLDGHAEEERGVHGEKSHVDSGRKKKEAPRSAEEDSEAREAGNTDDVLGEPSRRRPGNPPSGQRRAQWPAEDVARLFDGKRKGIGEESDNQPNKRGKHS